MKKMQPCQTSIKPVWKLRKNYITRYFLLMLVVQLLFVDLVHGQRYMEHLGRGIVAVRKSDSQVFISWRLLGTDPADIAFNIYRGSSKLNPTPITSSTNFTDNTSENQYYSVRAVINGQEKDVSKSVSPWTQSYLKIPLQTPTGYVPNDASVGDLDGDGEYEIILKQELNPYDNATGGTSGQSKLEAYKLDGTFLWRIDLGINIREGAHYTPFIVYDFDSDGKAEIAVRTSEGTIDGTGVKIGDTNSDNITDYRNVDGRILTGPEFLSIFDGMTGKEIARTDYITRGDVCDWGDCYGNRVDRFLMGVGYFDGKEPSILICRGYYEKTVLEAWDWRGGVLSKRWAFNSTNPGNAGYSQQGNHNISITDVDADGKDEIIYGSMTLDDDGKGLYTTGIGHGDAMHVSDLDPTRPGLEVFHVQERVDDSGMNFRDAKTGEVIWKKASTPGPGAEGPGRGLALDVDPNHKGYESWAAGGGIGGMYNNKGVQIWPSTPTVNFGVYWDEDLLSEILNGTLIDEWNYVIGASSRLLTAYTFGADDNNGSKATPCLSADIFGDWREEIIWRNNNNKELMIFTTTIPTSHRFYTFMHDFQYRISVAWQNVGYNQPPHLSYYFGDGMGTPPVPNIVSPLSQEISPIIAGKTYKITSLHSGKMLDIENGSSKIGTKIIQATPTTNGYTQNWTIKDAGNGYYSIFSPAIDKSLETISNNTEVSLWDNNNGFVNQQYQIIPLGKKNFQIVSRQTTKCLGISGESKSDDAYLQQMDCNGKDNQIFTFEILPDSVITSDFDGNALNRHLEEVIYPNPSHTSYKLNIKGAFSYTISDQLGIIMESGEGREASVVGEDLKPGIYILKIQNSQTTNEFKLIKN